MGKVCNNISLCTYVAIMSLLLSYHVVILFVYPIAIASLYFSRQLSWYALILSEVIFAAVSWDRFTQEVLLIVIAPSI